MDIVSDCEKGGANEQLVSITNEGCSVHRHKHTIENTLYLYNRVVEGYLDIFSTIVNHQNPLVKAEAGIKR